MKVLREFSEYNILIGRQIYSPDLKQPATIIIDFQCSGKTGGKITHECTNGGQKLRLHGLPLGEPASNQYRIIGNFVGNLVCKTSECGSRANQRR